MKHGFFWHYAGHTAELQSGKVARDDMMTDFPTCTGAGANMGLNAALEMSITFEMKYTAQSEHGTEGNLWVSFSVAPRM